MSAAVLAAGPIRFRTAEPLLIPNQPWENDATGVSVVGVIPDPEEDRLRMYYMVRFSGEGTRNILCVAFSKDGLSWVKPDLGEGDNIVMLSANHTVRWGGFKCKEVS